MTAIAPSSASVRFTCWWCNVLTTMALLLMTSSRSQGLGVVMAQANSPPSHSNSDDRIVMLQKANSVLEWIDGMDNGYSNSKHEVRWKNGDNHADGTNANDDPPQLGMFAKETIRAGEVLATIPWDAIIYDDDAFFTQDDEDSKYSATATKSVDSVTLPCNVVRDLYQQLSLGEDGDQPMNPWIEFLKIAELPSTPSIWSDVGKDLLQQVLKGQNAFTDIPPKRSTSWLDDAWEDRCNGGRSELEERAAIVVTTRSVGGRALVPIFDFYNDHSSEDILNVDVRIVEGKHVQIYATQMVGADEELFVSYDECSLCDRHSCYSAPYFFRDYGFIQGYPQTWSFSFDIEGEDRNLFEIDIIDNFDDDEDYDHQQYVITWHDGEKDLEAHYMMTIYLEQLARLRVDELTAGPAAWAKARGAQSLVPQSEWDAVIAYTDAAIVALTNALHSLPKKRSGDLFGCLNGVDEEGLLPHLYPSLTPRKIYQMMRRETCDFSQVLSYKNYTMLDDIQSEYQYLKYRKKVRGDDNVGNTCFELDDVAQICDNYRPHYHEYAINYAARFLKEIKRVAFIGGGDNMILQEVLKYPDLELVIGLELDQVVVRNSFKHFHTQPKFDDDRVEWWFGDATKSLLLLPKEYMNSFDLVMVDVSETAASLTVTKHLDILNAMSLLLKPEGIMVKNEPYFKEMSKTFDFTVDAHFYDCPMICDQSMILGSNRIDFFRAVDNLIDHKVENLLLPEIEDYPNKYYLWHDYSTNDPTYDGSCDKLRAGIEEQRRDDDDDGFERSGKSEGIFMAIELEHCKIPLNEASSIFMTALSDLGFSSIEAMEGNSDTSFEVGVVAAEGYMLGRRWNDLNYIAIDIYLWGHFHKMDDLRRALIEAFQRPDGVSTTSFRIATSGMYGNNSWEKDKKRIGPDLTKHTRKCGHAVDNTPPGDEKPDTAEHKGEPLDSSAAGSVASKQREMAEDIGNIKDDGFSVADTLPVALGTLVDSFVPENTVVLVFCGLPEAPCLAADALSERIANDRIHRVYICSKSLAEIDFEDTDIDLHQIHECRQSIATTIKDETKKLAAASDAVIIGGAILDGEAPFAMANIFLSFWTFRRNIFQNETVHLLVSVAPDIQADIWRHSNIRKIENYIDMDPMTRAEILVASKEYDPEQTVMELNVLMLDCEDAFSKIRLTEDAIAATFSSTVHAQSMSIRGGSLLYRSVEEHSPIDFSQHDYDLAAGKQQYKEQKALGRQSLFQLARDKDHRDSSPNIRDMLASALDSINRPILSSSAHGNLGAGVAILARFEDGHAVCVWDGRDHIAVSLFQRDQNRKRADSFLKELLLVAGDGWQKELRDDFPRGINHVINFSRESK